MAKAKKPTPTPTPAATPDSPAETPATADAAAGNTPASASGLAGLLRGFISPHMLFLALLVGLLSLAVDYEYLPSRIEPVAIEYDFAPRTLAQQQTYNDGVGGAPITSVFESAERVLEGQLLAPEDLAISPDGHKVFAGLRDGRVVYFTTDDKTGKLTMHKFGRTGNYQDTCGEPVMEKICGRPLGLAFVDGAAYARYVKRMEDPTFFPDSKMLLVADAYKGLILMDAFGQATKVFDTVGPRRIRFLNSLAVKENGEVYLTDSSRRHYRRDVHLEVLERKPTGRLLHFNPVTTRVSVLATDLSFPNGITLVDDETALLFALTNQNKLVKFDLKTKKMEDFAFLPGPPDNLWIETSDDNKSKRLFVGLTSLQPAWHLWVMGQPKVRKLMEIVIPPKYLREIASPHGAFVTVDLSSGDVTNVYKSSERAVRFLSGVHAVGDYYYLTTWNQDSITRIPKKAFA